MNRSWKLGALFWHGRFALRLSPNFSKLQSLGIENGENAPMVSAKLIGEPSAEFFRSADVRICVVFIICITDLPFCPIKFVFSPRCLVGTATGILVLGMHYTFYLLSEHWSKLLKGEASNILNTCQFSCFHMQSFAFPAKAPCLQAK